MEQEKGPKFYKFPKTIHLGGSSVVDEDETMSKGELKTLVNMKSKIRMVIQEKVDGANVSVHFEQEWTPIPQKRSGIIQSKEKPQYDVFRNWCYEKMEILWDMLKDEYCLFGEWLWARHSVSYNSLPDFFLAFDIMEKKTGKFLSNKKMKEIINDRLSVVPNLYEGEPKEDLDTLINSLVKKSAFGSEIAEGVYIRFEEGNYVLDRCKFRRKTFVAGREGFDKKVENNSLKP